MGNIKFQGLTCFTFRLEVERCNRSKDLGVLILESDHNPGYYSVHNFPPNIKKTNARHCYLIVKNSVNCFQDVVHRYTRDISKKFEHKLHIMPGQMTLHNESHQCIRINTRELEFLSVLIADLKSLGIDFLPDTKVEKYKSLIYFKKYIEFAQISEGIFKDINLPARYFFTIPNKVDFKEFESKIEHIKNSCGYHLFDAFVAHYFWKETVQDFVGIYSEHCDESRFSELKKELTERFV